MNFLVFAQVDWYPFARGWPSRLTSLGTKKT